MNYPQTLLLFTKGWWPGAPKCCFMFGFAKASLSVTTESYGLSLATRVKSQSELGTCTAAWETHTSIKFLAVSLKMKVLVSLRAASALSRFRAC